MHGSWRGEITGHKVITLHLLWGTLLVFLVLGTATCLVSIIGMLAYSLIPQQIDNSHWWYIGRAWLSSGMDWHSLPSSSALG